MQRDTRVETLMVPVDRAIRKHLKWPNDAFTEVHNRAYEAVNTALQTDYLDEGKLLRARIKELESALREVRIEEHHECGDCWYSCPKSDDYCGASPRTVCYCGKDRNNEIIDRVLGTAKKEGEG